LPSAIPDGGGVIHGCYSKASGAVRVTDNQTNAPKACTDKEQSLNWNQQGPQGLPGATGPKGDKGDSGASAGYIVTPDDTPVSGSTSVASLWLPAGSYILSAKLQAFSFGPQTINCTFGAGSDLDKATETISGNFSTESLSLTTAHSFGVGGYATLYCTSPSLAMAEHIVVTAVAVGQLHSL
jgi:hypothetical protein